jgi:hypothetical protein
MKQKLRYIAGALFSLGMLSSIVSLPAIAQEIPTAMDMSRGSVEFGLAEKNPNSPYLEESIDSYRDAIAKISKDTPQSFVIQTKSDLARALLIRSERTYSPQDALEAVALIESALSIADRSKDPKEWSDLQQIHGNALYDTFVFDKDEKTAQKSIRAFQEAEEIDADLPAVPHRLWLEYLIANVRNSLLTRTSSAQEYAFVIKSFSDIAETSDKIHDVMLKEYALSQLAKSQSTHAIQTHDTHELAGVVALLEQQLRRIKTRDESSFTNYVQMCLAFDELILSEVSSDPSLYERARIEYRETLKRNARLIDPRINATVAYLLSLDTFRHHKAQYDESALNEIIDSDERAVAELSPISDSALYEALKNQIAAALYFSASFGNTSQRLHAALTAWNESAAANIKQKQSRAGRFFEADLLARIADVDHDSDEKNASNTLFEALAADQAGSNIPEGSIQESYIQNLLRHANAFQRDADLQKSIAFAEATLKSGKVTDHRLIALLQSDLASGFSMSASPSQNATLLREAVTSRRAALVELQLVPSSVDRPMIESYLALDILRLGIALHHQRHTSESIAALKEAADLFKQQSADSRCSASGSTCNSARMYYFQALNVLSVEQPDDLDAARRAISAGREYFSKTPLSTEAHHVASLRVAYGYTLYRLGNRTHDATMRSEAESTLRESLGALNLPSDVSLVREIRKKLEAEGVTY